MARIRRLVLVGVVALTGAFVAGPAQADSPEVFSGSAAGTALDLSVLGKQASLGLSAAKVNSAGVATAMGAGSALPNTGLTTPQVDEADVDSTDVDELLAGYSSKQVADAKSGEVVDKPRVCQNPSVADALAGIVDIGLVCSSATADNGNHPSATGKGSVAEADVHVETVIQQLQDALDDTDVADLQIGGTLGGVLDTVCATVGETCDATTTVNNLVQSVLKTQTLDVELGTSTSSVTTGPSTVTSEATAAGAVIKILPLPQVGGVASTDPVVTITIGDAKAKTVYDRGTGKATATADPALVRVEFNDVLADQLGITNAIEVRPEDLLVIDELIGDLHEEAAESATLITKCDDGRAICILPDSPFESRIYLASGHTKVNDDGTATAVADAVRVDLLMGITEFIATTLDENGGSAATAELAALGLGDPGVHLALAHAESAVGGRQANIAPPKEDKKTTSDLPRSADEPPLELPRTGGIPWMPVLGAAGLALAVVFRRAALKATR